MNASFMSTGSKTEGYQCKPSNLKCMEYIYLLSKHKKQTKLTIKLGRQITYSLNSTSCLPNYPIALQNPIISTVLLIPYLAYRCHFLKITLMKSLPLTD